MPRFNNETYLFWENKNNRFEAAKKCINRNEYRKNYYYSYKLSMDNDELDEFFEPINIKPDFYWTIKENIDEAASKCSSRTDFAKKYPSAYKFIKNTEYINTLYPKLKYFKDYTFLDCEEILEKFEDFEDFRSNYKSLHEKIIKEKWDNLLYSKFNYKRKYSVGYWTKDLCLKESMKYTSKKDFCKYSRSAYKKACENKWIDDICSNYIKTGNKYKRGIYCFEFLENKVCYVGLTYNFKKREKQHLVKGPVTEYIKNNKHDYNFIILHDYVDVSEAKNLEIYYISKYINDGWTVLNTANGGAIGGGSNLSKFTYDYCKNEALKYTSRNDFNKGSNSAYERSRKNKWLDSICVHMKEKPREITYDLCKEIASSCVDIKDFQKNYPTLYTKSTRNGWLGDFNLKRRYVPVETWTYDKCFEAFKTCKNRTEFIKKFKTAYRISIKNNWIDDFTK